eukprot:g15500.t1
MLPKGSMGYVEPGELPSGEEEGGRRREDRKRFDENGFNAEQREMFEDLIDEEGIDQRPSKARTALNKEALELRNAIERDLKDMQQLMTIGEGQLVQRHLQLRRHLELDWVRPPTHQCQARPLHHQTLSRTATRLLQNEILYAVFLVILVFGLGFTLGTVKYLTQEQIDLLKRMLQVKGYTLSSGLVLFDQTGGGTLDRPGFMRFLDWAQASIPVVDQDAIFQRFYAGPGLLNYRELISLHEPAPVPTGAPIPPSMPFAGALGRPALLGSSLSRGCHSSISAAPAPPRPLAASVRFG